MAPLARPDARSVGPPPRRPTIVDADGRLTSLASTKAPRTWCEEGVDGLVPYAGSWSVYGTDPRVEIVLADYADTAGLEGIAVGTMTGCHSDP